MGNPLAIALKQSPTPDQMYAEAFAYFQSHLLFASAGGRHQECYPCA